MNNTESQKIVLESQAEHHMTELLRRVPQIIFDHFNDVSLRLEVRLNKTEYCLYVTTKGTWEYKTFYSQTTEGAIAQALEYVTNLNERMAKYYRDQAQENLNKAAEYEQKLTNANLSKDQTS